MAQTDYAEFDTKTSSDRTVVNVLYAMHTVAPFTLWSLSLVALIVNYIRRSDEHDVLYESHHSYMISTFWWTMLWLALTSPLWLLVIFPGAIAWTIVGIWYVYRCVRGWLRFSDNRPPY
jgi:uncharacterized membrane protein